MMMRICGDGGGGVGGVGGDGGYHASDLDDPHVMVTMVMTMVL